MNRALRWLTIRSLSIGLLLSLNTVSWAQEDLTALEEQAVRAATERVAPCVVRVEALGGVEQYQGKLLGTGPTTGVIVSEDGYILSSAFGYVGKPSSILVTLPSGERTAAELVARDHSRMLVLLKVAADEKLPVPSIVPRDQLHVGQWSIAVGRTYSSSFPNVSVGILSAKNRIWGKAVQT
ncbi:MAG: trypsin-like peptidase domain-containing protein, partial [Planctomycetota bacterium]